MATKSPLRTLRELEQAVRDAEARHAQLLIKANATKRRLATVEQPLRDYHREVGAGVRRHSDAEEAKILTQLRQEKLRLTEDELAATAQVAGAFDAIEARRQDVARFIATNRQPLTKELTPKSVAAAERLEAARDELYAAIAEWSTIANHWRRFLEQWGDSPTAVPPNPLAGATTDIERAFAPIDSGEPRDPRRLYPMPIDLAPARKEAA
jgi:hypothetical protein